jgi:large subunit ribosomal protein L18
MRKRRHLRVRKKIAGTAERPRLNVFRSLNQIYVQVIDDNQGHTLASISSLDPDLSADLKGKNKVERAFQIGEAIGARAKEQGIQKVVFDRGGYQFQGRVKAVAEGARKAGLEL